MKKYNKLLIILLVLMISGFFIEIEPDDKELFMGLDVGAFIVKPNVVVLMDSSGSMNTAIFYPRYGVDGIAGTADDGFDPNFNYPGVVDNAPTSISQTGWYARWIVNNNAREYSQTQLQNWDGKHFWTGCYTGDGTPNNFESGSYGWSYFRVGDKILFRDTASPYYSAIATLKSKYQKNGVPWFELEDIVGGPITPNGGYFQQAPDGQDWTPVCVKLYGVQDNGNNVRYDDNYLQWLFIHATDNHRAAVSHFSTYGTFDLNFTPPPEVPNNYGNPDWEAWWVSDCVTPGHKRIKYRFTRIQVAREVICKVATMSNEIVNLGLFRFDYDRGGKKLDDVTPSNDLASDLVAYKNMVAGIEAEDWTPLAEALADIWKYYKPGPQGSKDYWPVNYYSSVHDIEHWCQNNYVIIMTDGESTMDRFTGDSRFNGSIFKSKPVKRTKGYTTWTEWSPDDGWGDLDSNEGTSGVPSPYNPNGTYCPNYTCWYTDTGSDYLDDVAYFIRHQDLFPDAYFGSDPVDGWPGDQNIYTYTIGFTVDNDLLRETALNGDGAHYTANNYDELVQAFQSVITGIILRNFAFSSITAPKRTATTTNTDLTVSYVGYFMPSQASSIWDGHLLAFILEDKWGFDADGSDGVTADEFLYATELECMTASNGLPCERWLELSTGHKWDAADKIPESRNLYTHAPDTTTNIAFNAANKATLKPLLFEDKWGFDADGMNGVTADEYVYATEVDCLAASGGQPCLSWLENGCATCDIETDQIISKLNDRKLADIFHSDVIYVGPPPIGKTFIRTLNPMDPAGEKYYEFYETHKTRRKVLFTGTNDGIFHMFNADDEVYQDEREAGKEVWGFIPDEVLLSLRKIVIDHEHTYTVDGRLTVEDIYYTKEDEDHPTWSTILVFGMRRGGNAYYAMDVTEYASVPKLLWKFEHPIYSGQSWAKAAIGKILLEDPSDSTQIFEKWIVVLPGGFAFNEENSDDYKGKAIFVVDASNGQLIWMMAYDRDGDSDNTDNQLLTDDPAFNFPIPSSLTLVDKDNNGYVDTIYFGNLGGNLFKTDISKKDFTKWETFNLYKTNIPNNDTSNSTTITNINGDQITVLAKVFSVGQRVRGMTSNAQGYVTGVDNKVLTVSVNAGTFEVGEVIACRAYDPIYLSPSVHYNYCFQCWVSFGTGDRDRPRTDPEKGHFISIRDNGSTENNLTTLDDLSSYWVDDTLTIPAGEGLTAEKNGWFFTFPDDAEKLFDPEPIVLPDENFVPHIIFNTYQPPATITNPNQIDNPCAIPGEGTMTLYDIWASGCTFGELVEQMGGSSKTGRIAGGGVYRGQGYILYTSSSGEVADVPGGDSTSEGFDTEEHRFRHPGELLYFKEKKR
jgi:hypothetical protein